MKYNYYFPFQVNLDFTPEYVTSKKRPLVYIINNMVIYSATCLESSITKDFHRKVRNV